MATYEIHITAPVTDNTRRAALFTALTALGLKNKFFYRVLNLAPVEGLVPPGTPPIGHDLRNPGTMSSLKTSSYEEARRLVLRGMAVLARLGLKGNFEVERVIGPRTKAHPAGDLAREFPGFRPVPDSPAWENHAVWKGCRGNLPSMDKVVDWFVRNLGVAPHQIVDFGHGDERPDHATIISRVATVYQPSRGSLLAFARRLRRASFALNLRYTVAEQVVLVGEPK